MQTEDSRISYDILQLIGDDCYRIGGEQFLYSARSFNELLRIDSYPDYLDGLMGACVGYFRDVLLTKWHNNGGVSRLSKTDSDSLREVMDILESSALPKGRQIAATIQSWANENQVLHSKHYWIESILIIIYITRLKQYIGSLNLVTVHLHDVVNPQKRSQ